MIMKYNLISMLHGEIQIPSKISDLNSTLESGTLERSSHTEIQWMLGIKDDRRSQSIVTEVFRCLKGAKEKCSTLSLTASFTCYVYFFAKYSLC